MDRLRKKCLSAPSAETRANVQCTSFVCKQLRSYVLSCPQLYEAQTSTLLCKVEPAWAISAWVDKRYPSWILYSKHFELSQLFGLETLPSKRDLIQPSAKKEAWMRQHRKTHSEWVPGANISSAAINLQVCMKLTGLKLRQLQIKDTQRSPVQRPGIER